MSTETRQPELTESVASVAAESAEELLPEDTIDDQQLPFGFAKRHKVLLELNQEPALLYHTSDTPWKSLVKSVVIMPVHWCLRSSRKTSLSLC